MCDYHFTKNSPTSFPTGRLLAKIDLGLAAYGVSFSGGILVFVLFSPETLQGYANENPEHEDILHFLSLPDSEQLTVVGLYFGWYIFELLLAVLFFFGTRLRLLGALKAWMIVTIVNSCFGLISSVPVYIFVANKPLFVVCEMIILMYKLYTIYIVDLFLKEIVGRRVAAAIAAAALL